MTLFGEIPSDKDLERAITLNLVNFRKGATAPADVTIGTSPVVPALRFSAVNQLLSLSQPMPITNWNRGVDIDILLIWSLVNAQVNNDQLSVTMDYNAWQTQATGQGASKTSTQLTNNLSVITAEGLAIEDLYAQQFTLATGDATNPLTNADGVAFEIHLTNLTGVAAADLMCACIHYNAAH